ncbi:MAG: hypothetical protein HC899_38685 [Leptolyngbyaceae cyanobacterium SM1_4_3]|nr:hypothetical protein [Leptolyngbyaceae cyanobacterium SM1_4_3]
MVEQSQIYEWRRSRSGRSSGWWHEINSAAVTSSVDTELSTGWEVSVGTDELTNSSQQTVSVANQGIVQNTGDTGSPLTSQISDSTLNSTLFTTDSLGYSTVRLNAIDALSPNYLIGSELINLGLSSVF